MLDGRGFFLETGVRHADELIALSYDVAHFWRLDPEQALLRPLSTIVEHLDHAARISRAHTEP